VFINILSAVLAISWATIGNGLSQAAVMPDFGWRFIVYGLAQRLILAVDLLRYYRKEKMA
jgi:hypothetical protein